MLLTRDTREVGRLALNRPCSLNALSENMLRALQAALDEVARDEQARVVVLAAQGKAFCPGYRLKELLAWPEKPYHQRLFAQRGRAMLSIQRPPVPVLARAHGPAANWWRSAAWLWPVRGRRLP